MDIADHAEHLVKSIHDADANGHEELAASLRASLAELNKELVAQGFAPVEA